MAAEYTVAAVAAPIVVLLVEAAVLRTGLLRERRFWITVAVMLAFQVPFGEWLTKPSGTVVHYNDQAICGLRVPWNIPIEDFGFGFALVTATLLMWRWHTQRVERSGD